MNDMSPDGRPAGGLEALLRFDTCLLTNAVERLNVRPRNEGFRCHGPLCRFPYISPVVGYAVTGRIRTYMPPMTGKCYYDHMEWWRHVEKVPSPKVVVMEDCDEQPGFAALFGEVHARICQALGCVAFITNGAVRDLDAVKRLGLQLFSGSVSVSHAYAHVVEKLPPMAEQIRSEEQDLFAEIARPGFSVEALALKLQQFAERQGCI